MQPLILLPAAHNGQALSLREILPHEVPLSQEDVPGLLPPEHSVRKNLPAPVHSSSLYQWYYFLQMLSLQEVPARPDALPHMPAQSRHQFPDHSP